MSDIRALHLSLMHSPHAKPGQRSSMLRNHTRGYRLPGAACEVWQRDQKLQDMTMKNSSGITSGLGRDERQLQDVTNVGDSQPS